MITVCRICGKPIALMNLAPVPVGYYCQCPIAAATIVSPTTPTGLVQCSDCRWFVNPYTHTGRECERLRGSSPPRSGHATRQEVPQAFYDAFEGQELDL